MVLFRVLVLIDNLHLKGNRLFLLDRRHMLQIMAAAGVSTAATSAPVAPQEANVLTADTAGGNVDSVVVMGESRALLIDTQFSSDHAVQLADGIAASGRQLETVFTTHAHLDHYTGLPTLRDRFPGLRA